MKLHIRRPGPLDAGAMATLANALMPSDSSNPQITRATLQSNIAAPGTIWHLAEDNDGALLGLQWIAPHPDLPAETAEIASFVPPGKANLDVGSALFTATCQAAARAGLNALYAIVRSENEMGLAYYQSRGFERCRALHPDEANAQMTWARYDLRA